MQVTSLKSRKQTINTKLKYNCYTLTKLIFQNGLLSRKEGRGRLSLKKLSGLPTYIASPFHPQYLLTMDFACMYLVQTKSSSDRASPTNFMVE